MEVTGTYSNGNTEVLAITAGDVSGFDSTSPAADQVLTITVNGKTATYKIQILAESIIKYGDVNGDGVVDNKDLVLFKRYFANIISSFNNTQAADVNGDSVIDNKDLVLVKRYFAKVITVFPAQS